MWLRQVVVRVSTTVGMCVVGLAKLTAGVAVTLRVVSGSAAVTTRPALKANVVAAVPPDTVLELLDSEQGWFWVLLPPDAHGTRRAGWISAGEVEVLTGTPPLTSVDRPRAAGKPRQSDRQLNRAKKNLDKARQDYEKLTGEGSP